MASENTLRFRLDGLEYALRGEKTPEQLQQIVDMVCRKVAEIREVAPNYSAVRTSTLAALQLAEELIDVREESRQLLEEAAARNRTAPRRRRTPRREEAPAAAESPEKPVPEVLFPEQTD